MNKWKYTIKRASFIEIGLYRNNEPCKTFIVGNNLFKLIENIIEAVLISENSDENWLPIERSK